MKKCYTKSLLVFLWLLFASAVALVRGVFRWGDWRNLKLFSNLFSWGACKIAGVTVVAEGLEHWNLPGSIVYTGNHQSGFDMATFGKYFPDRCTIIGKREILWVPLLGLLFQAGGALLINRKNRHQAITKINEVFPQVREKQLSLGFFPEGTRNKTDEPLLPFKKGAFHVALSMQIPIVPWVCSSIRELALIEKGIFGKGQIVMRFLPPIPTAGLTEADLPALMQKTRDLMLQTYLEISSPHYVPKV